MSTYWMLVWTLSELKMMPMISDQIIYKLLQTGASTIQILTNITKENHRNWEQSQDSNEQPKSKVSNALDVHCLFEFYQTLL